VAASAAKGGEKAVVPSKPNIIVFIADDIGIGDVGCFGSKDIPTPNIDRIAKSGIRFTSGYVTAALCSPSRSAFLTGRYQQRFGLENNTVAETKGMGRDLKEITIANLLRGAGYRTGLIGKWHHGAQGDYRPTKRGFEEFFGYCGAFFPYYPKEVWRGENRVPETEYSTDAFAREGINFINRHKNEPFFLTMAFNACHENLKPKPEVLAKFDGIKTEKRRIFAAVVSSR
jgi:arylsulfatase A-like enzyme